ncbi:hypothetical protein SAY87_021687 [Trapa incisa]|uniref:Uncharacterized protein n=2 Tax=Trapa TaxID=22665 RepID=A0AAN7N4T4_TRANT|nr:hypothetical protein SAY87_021687 [Trapa incisa]KAK4804771.1 hypothetical protein SAY86_004588 [Trapa natans]
MGRVKRKKNPRNLRTVCSNKKQVEDKPLDWVIDINRRLGEGHIYDAGRSWTIYRVPNNLREVHRSVFVPKIISIGPFHNGDPRLQAMEEHKMRYLMRLLGGKFEESGEVGEKEEIVRKVVKLEDLVNTMKSLEQKTRACYSEFFDIPSDDFVQMMVIDGCFLIELLRLFYKFDKQEIIDDPIFDIRWMLRTLQRDLLMLENQLPFFILEELFKLCGMGKEEEPSLLELAATFFDPLLPREDIVSKLRKEEEYGHILDVFRGTFLPTVRERVNAHGWSSHDLKLSAVQDRQLIHCAVELKAAGLQIRKRENSDILDVCYNNDVLMIPPLHIDDNSVPLFFNFIAFEQCDEAAKPFFTNFFIFLDSLIYSKADVQILHKEGIINHVLGSDKDVAILINRLGREIVYDQDQCYLYFLKEVNDRCKVYYESRWRNWWRSLTNNYFSNPWSFLSVVAAICLLILTFLQTFYTMYPIE